MSFNFGAFAGGLSDGFHSGVKLGKTMRDIIKENKLKETLEQARVEAGQSYDGRQSAKAASVEEGPAQAGEAYKTEGGGTVTPIPAANVVATGLPPLASPTASPDAAGAATAAASQPPPAVSTQTPAAPAMGASADGNAGEAEAATAIAQPTPQQAAAAAPAVPANIASDGLAKPGVFTANGQQSATRQEAEANAGVRNDPAARTAHIEKHMAQKAQEHLLAQGDIEGAEKYGKHAESISGKQAIKDWAVARTAPDIDTRAKAFGKYYTDHVNDGVDYSGHKILTKADGTQVAVVSLKDKTTGKTSEMELTDEKMVQLGDAWNPAAVFKNETARATATAAQKAEIAKEGYKSKLRMGEESYKADRLDQREGLKAGSAQELEVKKGQQRLSEITLKGQIESQNVGEKSKAELTAKTDALKAAGYTDEEIKPMVPMLLKVGEYKKMTDPAERRAIIGTELMKSDPTFSRASADEQRARIDKAMSAILGQPAADGAPADAKPSAPAAPQLFRDKRAPGRVFKYEGGKMIDAGADPSYKAPAAAGPAGGVQTGSASGQW